MTENLVPLNAVGGSLLTAEQFHRLADVPPEAQWFANLGSAQTRRAYEADIRGFMRFAGIDVPQAFRAVARGHVLAWRNGNPPEKHRFEK